MTKRPISTAAHQEADGDGQSPRRSPSTDTAAPGGETRDDAEDDEAEHVVDDRRADDDAGLRRWTSGRGRRAPGR